MLASQSAAQVHCTKCGIKHSRPVGVRCKKLLNNSAPVVESNSELDSDSFIAPNQQAAQQAAPGSSSSGSSAASAAGSSHTASANMEAKLYLILKRMDALADKKSFGSKSRWKPGSQGGVLRSLIAHLKRRKSAPSHALQITHLKLVSPKNPQALLTHLMTATQYTAHILVSRKLAMTATTQSKSQ